MWGEQGHAQTVPGGGHAAAAILDLGLEGLEGYIKTIGLYKSKARHLMETCRILVERHGGVVPRTRRTGTTARRGPQNRQRC